MSFSCGQCHFNLTCYFKLTIVVGVTCKCGNVALFWHADAVMDCSSPACASSTTWAQACRVPPPYHPLFSRRPTLPTTSFSALVPMLALLSRKHLSLTCTEYFQCFCNTRTCDVDGIESSACLPIQSAQNSTSTKRVWFNDRFLC